MLVADDKETLIFFFLTLFTASLLLADKLPSPLQTTGSQIKVFDASPYVQLVSTSNQGLVDWFLDLCESGLSQYSWLEAGAQQLTWFCLLLNIC